MKIKIYGYDKENDLMVVCNVHPEEVDSFVESGLHTDAGMTFLKGVMKQNNYKDYSKVVRTLVRVIEE